MANNDSSVLSYRTKYVSTTKMIQQKMLMNFRGTKKVFRYLINKKRTSKNGQINPTFSFQLLFNLDKS